MPRSSPQWQAAACRAAPHSSTSPKSLLLLPLQGIGSRAFSIFAAVAAQRGLLLQDPSAQFADEEDVHAMLQAAGYASCQLESSREANLRPGVTPQQWAAAGWEQCMAMPFADLPALLPPGELEAMRSDYLCAAAQLAEGFVEGDGIAEPYVMLWVLACC